jgi:hypothetical protein
MATSQNPGGPDPQQSAKATEQALRDILKLNGDYNNQLKNGIKDLDQQIKAYGRIEAKLASLEKSSINIKELNNEIFKNTTKQYITQKKLSDLESQMGSEQKKGVEGYLTTLEKRTRQERALVLAQRNGQKGLESYFLKALQNTEKELNTKQDSLDIDQLSYIAAKRENELIDKTTKSLKEQLKTEKEINKSIGLTGAVFGNFAKKLGIGDEYYEKMVLKARQLNSEGKKFSFGDKLDVFGKAAMGAAKETLKDPVALVGAIAGVVPVIGGIVSGIVGGLKAALDFILGIQDTTVKFGRSLGISTEQATNLRKQFAEVNLLNGDLLVNTEKLMASQTELTALLGTQNILTTEQLSTNIKLNELLGLDAQARASIAQSSVITGKSSEDITQSVLAQVEGLKAATGIGLDYRQVLDQASKLGGALGLQFAQYPGKIAKALVVTKSFGLELKQLDGLADSFLDFESSISKEFEAQVLLGREINLTKARQAFLDNDLATAAAEISKNAGSYLEFNKMNRIQQEAIAGAVGMSRDQLGDMLKNQLYLDKLGAKETASSVEKLKLAKERFKTEEEINKQLGEGAYQNLVTMSASEKIAAFIDKIRTSIGDFLTSSGIIEKLTKLFDYFSKPENIQKAMMMVKDFTVALIHMVGTLVKGIAGIARFFYAISHEDKVAVGNFFDEAEGNVAVMGTGGMSDTATLNTGTVASQKMPASNNTSALATANREAPLLANPNFSIYIDSEPVYKSIKQKFETDPGLTKR